MKKALLLTLFVAMAAGVFAQSQRMVLLEHFTQASCGPCATYNPLVKQYFENTTTSATAIKYQTSWPGTDPMNGHNAADVQTRVNYYGVSGVPNVVIDGNVAQGNPGTLFSGGQSSDMDNRAAVASDFDITVSHTLSADYGSVNVTGVITASNTVNNANLVAHVVVVEKAIVFSTAPGSNGETEFNNVMKKMLPSSAGQSIQASWSNGNTVVLSEDWTIANVYNLAELAAIVFIQDDVTKEILQVGFSEFLTPSQAVDAAISSSDPTGTGSATIACHPGVTPTVELLNFGTSPLTSADINYSINGVQATYNWTGNLATFATTTVALPALSYTPSGAGFNQFSATVANPNGSTDPYAGNDNSSGFFEYISQTTLTEYKSSLTLSLTTDNYGAETTWEMLDGYGNVVQSGSGYANNTTVTETINLPDGDCYIFIMKDSYGDGICCTYGNGEYTLTDSDGNVVISQTATSNPFNGSEKISAFKTLNTVSTETATLSESLSVYPNPATDNFVIEFELTEAAKLDINLMNAIGQKVSTIEAGNFNGGEHLINVNTAGLPSGTYFVTIRSEAGVTTKTITVSK